MELTVLQKAEVLVEEFPGAFGFFLFVLFPWSRIRPGTLWWSLYSVLIALGLLWFYHHVRVVQLEDRNPIALVFSAAIITVQLATILYLHQLQRRASSNEPTVA